MIIRFNAFLRFFVIIFITIIITSFFGCVEEDFNSDIITEEELAKIDERNIDLNPLFDYDSLDDDSSYRNDDNGTTVDTVIQSEAIVDKSEESVVLQKHSTVALENTDVKVDVTDVDNKDNQKTYAPNTGDANKSESLNYDSSGIIAAVDNKETITYILNKNTKKFHYQACESASEIKPKNKDIGYDRDDILNRGFVPCKRCKP